MSFSMGQQGPIFLCLFALSPCAAELRPWRLDSISFPLQNVPGQKLESDRSPVCLCVCSQKYLHRLWFRCWGQNLSSIHTGNCQMCWYTVLPGTSLAAPDTHWCLPERKKETLSLIVCVQPHAVTKLPLSDLPRWQWWDLVGNLLLQDTTFCTRL